MILHHIAYKEQAWHVALWQIWFAVSANFSELLGESRTSIKVMSPKDTWWHPKTRTSLREAKTSSQTHIVTLSSDALVLKTKVQLLTSRTLQWSVNINISGCKIIIDTETLSHAKVP